MAVMPPCLAVCLLLLALPPPARPLQSHVCTGADHRPHPRGVCGPRLAALTVNLCTAMSGNGAMRYMVRRSVPDVFLPETPTSEDVIDTVGSTATDYYAPQGAGGTGEKLRGVFLNKREAFSYLSKREATGSIVCECCYNACRLLELAAYCRIPPRRSRRVGHSRQSQGHTGHSRHHYGRRTTNNHLGRRATNNNNNVENSYS